MNSDLSFKKILTANCFFAVFLTFTERLISIYSIQKLAIHYQASLILVSSTLCLLPLGSSSLCIIWVSYNGADKVLCLRDLLLELSTSSRDAEALKETLLQPLDHTDYSHSLLTGTYCVIKPGAPPLAEGFSLKQTCDQLQASKSDLHPIKPLSGHAPFTNAFFIIFCSCCTERSKLICSLSRVKPMSSATATARSVTTCFFFNHFYY